MAKGNVKRSKDRIGAEWDKVRERIQHKRNKGPVVCLIKVKGKVDPIWDDHENSFQAHFASSGYTAEIEQVICFEGKNAKLLGDLAEMSNIFEGKRQKVFNNFLRQLFTPFRL